MDIIALLKVAEQNSGVLGSVASVILLILGWFSRQIYMGFNQRIKMAHEHARAAAKAAAQAEDHRRADIKRVHENLNDHIQRDLEMHHKMLDALGEQTKTLHGIHTSLLTELGDRPTREEVAKHVEALRQMAFRKDSNGA